MFGFPSSPSPFAGDSTDTGIPSSSCLRGLILASSVPASNSSTMFGFSSSPSPSSGWSTVTGTSSSSCLCGLTLASSVPASNSSTIWFGFSSSPSRSSGWSAVTGTSPSSCLCSSTPASTVPASSSSPFALDDKVTGSSGAASPLLFEAPCRSSPASTVAVSSSSPFSGDTESIGTSGSVSSSCLSRATVVSSSASTVPASSTSPFALDGKVTGISGTASPSLFEATCRSSSASTVAISSFSPISGDSKSLGISGSTSSSCLSEATFGSTPASTVPASSLSIFASGAEVTCTSGTASTSLFGATSGSTPASTVAVPSFAPLSGDSESIGTSGSTSSSYLSEPRCFNFTPSSTVPDLSSSLPSAGSSTVTTGSSDVSSSTLSSTSGKPCGSTASAYFALSAPSFSDFSSSTEESSSLGPKKTRSIIFTFPPVSLTPFESLSSPSTGIPTSTDSPFNSSSSVSSIAATVSAPLSATVPDGCSPELQEVTAILASRCDKFLSVQAPQSQGKVQKERQGMTPQATSSSKPVDAAASAEQKFGESGPCSIPMTSAPSTSGSLVLSSSQPAEEELPYLPPVDLLDSTIDVWERVVANKMSDQEVTDEGLRHFYEGINYFCLQYKRLQEATAKYNDVAKASDDLEMMMASLEDKLAEARRKLEAAEKDKKRLENELAGTPNIINALTVDKESLLRVQTLLHQKIFELTREMAEAGPTAIEKYKASASYKQELMEYAAAYMGKGVKLAIDKIKAKEPSFDPKTYGLEKYLLPPEVDDVEFSPDDEGKGGVNQDHNEMNPSAPARDLADQSLTLNDSESTVLGLSAEEAKYLPSSA